MISFIGATRLTSPESPYFPHDHPYYELIYIHEGSGHMQTTGDPIHFSPNSLFIIPPKTTHTLISNNGHYATSILIDNELLDSISNTVYISDNKEKEAETLIKLMVARKDTLPDYLQHLGNALVLLVLDLISKIDAIHQDHAKAVENIIKGIKENFSDPEFKIKSLLSTSAYAEDYIRSIFKEQTGMTPNQMLSETRLNNAKNIILSSKTDSPIANIALNSGFDDLAYFSKAFKNRYGMSPSEFKEKHGKH